MFKTIRTSLSSSVATAALSSLGIQTRYSLVFKVLTLPVFAVALTVNMSGVIVSPMFRSSVFVYVASREIMQSIPSEILTVKLPVRLIPLSSKVTSIV